MQEARAIEGVTNYPYFYIPQSRKLIEKLEPPNIQQLKDAIKKIVQEISLLKDIEKILVKQTEKKKLEDDLKFAQISHDLSTPIINIGGFPYKNGDTDDYGFLSDNYNGKLYVQDWTFSHFNFQSPPSEVNCIKTRPDEYIVLILYDIRDCKCNTPTNWWKKKRTTFITNYGNISVLFYNTDDDIRSVSSSPFSTRDRITLFINGSLNGSLNYNEVSSSRTFNFTEKELPPKECYTPQLFVDVISTFLNCIKSFSNEGFADRGRSTPYQNFKKLCLEFHETFGLSAEKNIKLQKENEKLKKTITELKSDVAEDVSLIRIFELESENETLKKTNQEYKSNFALLQLENEKLKKTISQYDSAFNVLEKEKERLEQELLELKEEVFGLKSFYGLPLKFRFRNI